MPTVQFIRPELAAMMWRYRVIRDCLIGSEAVKRQGRLYLPMPNASDQSKENRERYIAYKTRAVFYNVTGRTLAGLLGQVFSRDPVIELPDAMDMITNDSTGGGMTLVQSANKTLGFTLSYGRSGLLVDFPTTDGDVTAAQVQSGEVRPTITTYDPLSIVNWRTITIGAKTMLALVVLAEAWPYHDDGFEIKTACQFRVLRLDANTMNYVQEIWQEPQPTNWVAGSEIPRTRNFQLSQTINPTGPDGLPLSEIPFKFIGIHNNDESIDNPPLFDLADLNMAHYRNSADYEEACYMLGQPTYWFSGLTKDWVENVLKGKVQLGSTGGVMLPANASAGLLQPEPNTMCKEAMDAKERQMVALGAKLVEQRDVQRTAQEATQEKNSELSILASAAKNVSAAYNWALNWCGYFMGIVQDVTTISDDVSFQLNSDYQMMNLTSADRLQLIKEWQAGALTFEEVRSVLRKAGVATLDDEDAMTKIAAEQAEELKNALALQGTANPGNAPAPSPAPTTKPNGSK